MQNGPSNAFKVAIVFSVLLYVVYAAVPYWPQKVNECGHACSCAANLKQIESAKEQWAMDNHKPSGSSVAFSDLIGGTLYIKAKPSCPKGGLYIVNGVGQKPTCSYPGHELP